MGKKNTSKWVKAKGRLVLNVDGTEKFAEPGKNGLAAYDNTKGTLMVTGCFNVGKCEFNEGTAARWLGPRLKMLIGAKKYLCIAERVTQRGTAGFSNGGKIRDGSSAKYHMRLEFHALCPMPEPEKIGSFKDVIREYVENHS